MIRVLAIDDEPLALQQLVAYIRKIPFLELVAECQSAIQAQEVLNQEPVDAIFCDINMPDLNGMDFVKSLVAPPLVVFTTAYSEYAVDGFRVNAVDYLLKPFGLQEFQRAAQRLKDRLEGSHATEESAAAQTETLFLKTDYRIVNVNIRDIVVNHGAEMVVAIAGDIMRMPGLPKSPQAERIDIINGEIEGLS
jgi:DNA-binding LytR/AlgR family response regulator